MAEHRIVFLERASVDATFRPPAFPHAWVEHAETAPGEIVPRLRGADIAIVNKLQVTEAVLAALPELRLVAVAATGTDGVDLKACAARGVRVANVRRYATTSVPEHTLMLTLALSRSLAAYAEDVRAGAWGRSKAFCLLDHPIRDLAGATFGVVGFGALGQATARLAEAFGMQVLVAERRGASEVRPGRTTFEDVLREVDVLSLHAPLTPETRGLVGPRELALMRSSAFLVNTARGALLDEAAVAGAVASGRLAGVAVDVLEEEPPRRSTPLLALAGRPNVLVTPHVAWASRGAMQRLADQVIDNLEAFVRGAPGNFVV